MNAAITKVQSAIVIAIIVIAALGGYSYYQIGAPTTAPITTTSEVLTSTIVSTGVPNPENYVFLTDLGQMGDVDPVDCDGNNCRTVFINMIETLIWYPNESSPVPQSLLADSWRVSADSMTYTFHLREGVKFTDGNPVRPIDVQYSFGRFLAYNNPRGVAALIEPWMTGHNPGEYIPWNDISRAITTDEAANTVTFHLKMPYAAFLSSMTFPVFGIYSSQFAISHGSWKPGENVTGQSDALMQDGKNLVGSGPFTLTENVPGQKYVLTRNDAYWRGPAKIKTLTVLFVPEWSTRLLMLQHGDADSAILSGDVASQVSIDPNLRLFVAPNSGFTEAIFFNFNIPLNKQPAGTQGITSDWFHDIHLRRAFAYAFPYQDYAKQAYLGYAKPAGPAGWLPLGQFGSVPNGYPYTYDPAKATEEFKLAWGGKVWENGFTMTYGYQEFQKGPALIAGQLYAESLQKINPKFHLIPQLGDWPPFFDWPIQMAVNQNGPDPSWLSSAFESSGLFPSYTNYKNQTLDDLLRKGASTGDAALREQYYKEANGLLAADIPAVFTVYWPALIALGTWVHGYAYAPAWTIDAGYGWYISKY